MVCKASKFEGVVLYATECVNAGTSVCRRRQECVCYGQGQWGKATLKQRLSALIINVVFKLTGREDDS